MSASTGWAARLGLDPLMGDGAAGRTTLLSGTHFEASTTYTVRVGGFAVIPATVASDANGAIAPTAVRLPALPRGDLDVLLASAVYTRSFTGAYHVQPSLCVELTEGFGRFGETSERNQQIPNGGWVGMVTRIRGTGFAAGASISATTMTIGGVLVAHPTVTIYADGTLPTTTLVVTSNLPLGAKDLVINDGTAATFTNVYEVKRSIALSPARVRAAAGTTILVEGWGFTANASTGAITIGGAATNPAALTTGADGSFSATVALLATPATGAVVFGAPQNETFAGCFEEAT